MAENGKARTAENGCPVCGKATDGRYRPFCSKRCADVDLGRWFSESYRIPAADEPDEEEIYPPEDGDGAP